MKIILDTNFLLIPAQFSVDIYSQLRSNGYNEFITMSACIDELEKLKAQKKHEKHIKIALELLKKNSVSVVQTSIGADAAIADYACDEHNKIAVATLDIALIKALKKKGVKVIRLRQKKYIVEA
jgi:rRNA-processing protein FCF1